MTTKAAPGLNMDSEGTEAATVNSLTQKEAESQRVEVARPKPQGQGGEADSLTRDPRGRDEREWAAGLAGSF